MRSYLYEFKRQKLAWVPESFARDSRAPFWTGTGGSAIYASPDGEVVVAVNIKRALPFDRDLIAINRKGEKIWTRLGYKAYSLCYSPVRNTVLTYEPDPPRIEELNAKTGETLHVLKETKLGPLADLRRISHENRLGIASGGYGAGRLVYDTEDQEKFWVTDEEHHVVYLTDFEGRIHHLIGEYSVAGSDEKHLNYPVSVSNTINFGRLLIADWGNHRVVEFHPDWKIRSILPFPEPRACYLWGNQVAVHNGGWPSSKYGIFIFSDHLGLHPIAFLQYLTDTLIPHPQDPSRLLINWDEGFIREIIIDEEASKTIPPATAILFENRNVTSDDFVAISPPIIDLYRPNKNVYLMSNKDGAAEVEVASFRFACRWNGKWETIDTIELKAGRLASWSSSKAVGICRIKLKLKDKGIVNGWVHVYR